MTKLSIITVNYNSGLALEKTVLSLSDFISNDSVEYIVVDACSTDESGTFIKNNEDKFNQLLIEKDKGIFDAMNKGIKLASGDWIWFINSGDILSDRLELIPLLDFICSVKRNVNLIYSDLKLVNGRLIKQDYNCYYLLKSMLNHQNLIYKKSLLDEGYDIKYKYCADFAHLISNFSRVYSDKFTMPLCLYDTNGISSYLNKSARISIWSERLRAFIHSSLPIHYKLLGMVISCFIVLIKSILPKFGSIVNNRIVD